MLAEPIPLNEFQWFPAFLKTRWYSFGLQTIQDESVAHLADLMTGLSAETASGTNEKQRQQTPLTVRDAARRPDSSAMPSTLFENCIYTIAKPDTLHRHALGQSEYQHDEAKPWKTGLKWWKAAENSNNRLPIILGNAADCSVLLYWGLIREIDISPTTGRTRCIVDRLRQIPGRRAPQDLRLVDTGKFIADGFIKPYALCSTPKFVERAFLAESMSPTAKRRRSPKPLEDVPTAEQYAHNLAKIESTVSSLERRLLLAHYAMPNHAATASELASAADVSGGYSVVNLAYARLARRLFESMGRAPGVRPNGSFRWWTVWSTGYWSETGFVWQMLPEVATAIKLLGWDANVDSVEPPTATNAITPSPGALSPNSLPHSVDWKWREGTHDVSPDPLYVRREVPPHHVQGTHRRLQSALASALRSESGVSDVIHEEGFVDLKVVRADGTVDLVEIKTTTQARDAIREALGQLLEYQYAAVQRGEKVARLRVAAPGELTAQDQDYIAHLQGQVLLDIDYIDISEMAGAIGSPV